MTARQRLRLAAFRRGQSLLDLEKARVRRTNAVPARAQLDRAIEKVERCAVEQEIAIGDSASARARKAILREELRVHLIGRLAPLARGPDAPRDAALLSIKTPWKRVSDHVLLTRARSLVPTVEKHADYFASHGALPRTVAQQLRGAIAAVDGARRAGERARANLTTATAGIRTGLQSGRSALRVLGALIGSECGARSRIMRVWTRVTRVKKKPGRKRLRRSAAARR